MIYSIKACEEAWESSRKTGTLEERIRLNQGWMKYFNHLAMKANIQETFDSNSTDKILDFLIQEKILTEESSVLDIGAGTGNFALPFAAVCKKVTALDMCKEALQVLGIRAKAQGLCNIEIVQEMWEKFPKNCKYDITFTSMCTAICNKEELLNMEAITSKYCCMITVMQGSYALRRQELRQRLITKPLSGLSPEVIHFYNLLYAMGRSPNVKCYSQHQKFYMPAEEAYETYRIYYQIFGLEGEQHNRTILEYIKEHAVDGVLSDEVQLNFALVYWQV